VLTVADFARHIEIEFGSRLAPMGFQRLDERRWVRSQKATIRELFVINSLKGATYSPSWGFSSGVAPAFRGRSFRRQSTDKNAIMDLIIDPIDLAGDVPRQAFSFLTGHDREIPIGQIRICAEQFVPRALADFDRVHSLNDFCRLFVERSQLQYRRFAFDMYTQHRLVRGFVLLLTGQRSEGLKLIREFCRSMNIEFEHRVLSDCIRHAESLAST
jgi:hypothetical protein